MYLVLFRTFVISSQAPYENSFDDGQNLGGSQFVTAPRPSDNF